jgi:hypothetical protein
MLGTNSKKQKERHTVMTVDLKRVNVGIDKTKEKLFVKQTMATGCGEYMQRQHARLMTITPMMQVICLYAVVR